MGSVVPARALVLGIGVTGRAVVEALAKRGAAVTATDDAGSGRREAAEAAGASWVDPPTTDAGWQTLVAGFDGLLPSPGVPERHPIFAAARETGVPIRSELDLAAEWDQHRPHALITGTNGKTTVTLLATEMLRASGRKAVACGNLEVPLVAAIDDPAAEAFVVEVSSFRLTFATAHRAEVATWLNFAPDHLDVHLDLAGYEAAKARIWANHELPGGPLAVANADDPVVMRHAPAGERTQTFGLHHESSATGSDRPAADWHVADGRLRGPAGIDLVAVEDLPRALPHDLSNSLAAAATARAMGATLDGIRAALVSFRGLPHRVELVGEAGGVRWYDDSKATAPHATVAALEGFTSAVLIAGGRNKGLDLGQLTAAAPHVRAVVGIGEAGPDVVAAFEALVPTRTATSMDDAVVAAAALAEPGDAVLLSPACASFDRYSSYAERGDDFQRAVREHLEVAP